MLRVFANVDTSATEEACKEFGDTIVTPEIDGEGTIELRYCPFV